MVTFRMIFSINNPSFFPLFALINQFIAIQGKLYILNVEDEDEKDKRPYACNAYSRRLLLLNQGELTILEVEKGTFLNQQFFNPQIVLISLKPI